MPQLSQKLGDSGATGDKLKVVFVVVIATLVIVVFGAFVIIYVLCKRRRSRSSSGGNNDVETGNIPHSSNDMIELMDIHENNTGNNS